jgi:anti-sigma factor RsiW
VSTVDASHRDVEAVLAAYALDAVDRRDAAAVERHVPDCPDCRRELAAHREAAAALADDLTASPAGVWERIQAEIDRSTPRREVQGRWRGPRS